LFWYQIHYRLKNESSELDTLPKISSHGESCHCIIVKAEVSFLHLRPNDFVDFSLEKKNATPTLKPQTKQRQDDEL
jgi:hypothetical protein